MELHAGIEVFKQASKNVWEEIRDESKDIALEVARGIQDMAEDHAAKTADKVSTGVVLEEDSRIDQFSLRYSSSLV